MTEAERVQVMYQQILDMVEQGFTIKQSYKHFYFDGTIFYKNITPIQKHELNSMRTIHTLQGAGNPPCSSYFLEFI